MDIRGRRVVVFGLAGSGLAAARLAVEKGAHVIGVDQREDIAPIDGVTLELGPHREATFTGADLVVVSPGIPATVAPIRAAQSAGVPVIGEIHFAAAWLPQPAVAITGTNGKSTTTHFAGQLLEAAGLRPFVGGNLGRALSEAALAASANTFDTLVVEVSSYQMELPNGAFRPKAAVIMNLTPDHLARHGTMDGYAAMKCRLFDGMKPADLAILPAGDDFLARAAAGHGRPTRLQMGALPGVRRDGKQVHVRLPWLDTRLDLEGFAIPGEHNLDNAALAALLALSLGAPTGAVQRALAGLQPLEHRMQIVAERDGVRWIDDSKATNVAATLTGLKGLPRDAGVVLLGGEAKGDAFAELTPYLGPWKVVTFGGSGDRIADDLVANGVLVTRAAWLEDAVAAARRLVRPGEVVLLSPGCASFDQFRNFSHRGEAFAALARAGAQ